MTWMQYNMGLDTTANLNGLLAQTQKPSGVKTPKGMDVCEAWFYESKVNLLIKDGGTTGFSSLVNIVGTSDPGTAKSTAGVFIFVNQKHSLSTVMAGIFDVINDTTNSPVITTPELDGEA